jgi:hypothetical protein
MLSRGLLAIATAMTLLVAASAFTPAEAVRCPPGHHWFRGRCVRNGPAPCPVGFHRNPRGVCVRNVGACPPGFYRNVRGVCVRRFR